MKQHYKYIVYISFERTKPNVTQALHLLTNVPHPSTSNEEDTSSIGRALEELVGCRYECHGVDYYDVR